MTAPAREHHHGDVSGGWLRAAVFGAMDGLVSNTGLISGVAGGGVAPNTIIVAGFAGLVAGAISMARRELERNPEVETEELAHMWMARGLPAELAHEVARVVHTNPEEALRVHAREGLG